MGLPIIGGILSTVGKLVLPALGKLGKGKATVAGVGLVAATSAVLAPQFPFDLNEALRQVLEIVREIGIIVGLMGYGRKSGYAAKE